MFNETSSIIAIFFFALFGTIALAAIISNYTSKRKRQVNAETDLTQPEPTPYVNTLPKEKPKRKTFDVNSHFPELLVERPEDMDFLEYRYLLAEQNRRIRSFCNRGCFGTIRIKKANNSWVQAGRNTWQPPQTKRF